MRKKEYMAPTLEVTALQGEDMICVSIPNPQANGIAVGDDAADDEEFAKRRGWFGDDAGSSFGW